MKSLIDNGSHLVLIPELLVNALGLKHCHLNNPIPVSIVIPTSNKPKEMSLHEYVLLQPVSLDGSWTSKFICAVITDSFCVPLLLGLLFLAMNRLITDHEKCSCIDKKNGYDLLYTDNIQNENNCPLIDSKIQHSNVKLAMAMVTVAPVKHSEERPCCTGRLPAQFNPVAAVCECIESLVCQQRLETLECELKKKYHAVFNLIPHCNELLTSMYACVKLKDDTKTITTCNYKCPRRYRPAFASLLQTHLNSEKLHPSNSPFTSLAFIIPKKDPTAAPHWVNNYRQLNSNTVVDNHPLPCIDDILVDCVKGKVWATINMTDSFFQTWIHPDDIGLTAVSTPLGITNGLSCQWDCTMHLSSIREGSLQCYGNTLKIFAMCTLTISSFGHQLLMSM